MGTMEEAHGLLGDYSGRILDWARPPSAPVALNTDRVLFGRGQNSLEVATGWSDSGPPRVDDIRRLFKLRQANRPSPVLLVIVYTAHDGSSSLAAVTGTSGDPAPAFGMSVDRVERLVGAALSEPDRHTAARTIDRLLAGLKDQLTPGLVNVGLFASHELRTGVPARKDWISAGQVAAPLLGLRGMQLIKGLGYGTLQRGSAGLLLTDDDKNRAIAVLLDETELFDRPAARFGALSPIAYGLSLATREGLPWLVVLRGTQIRLYPARTDVGVGRKGQAETYVELDLALLGDEDAAYLTLIFSPRALGPDGSVQQILLSSENFAASLGDRLRERIYVKVVPGLAVAVGRQMQARGETELTEAYHCSLLVLFRLLFLAYAEDRGLLPYGRNPLYDRHAIKTLAKEFAANAETTFDCDASGYWDDMQTLWEAVDEGNKRWSVPAYNGGLFATDTGSGATLAQMRLTDAEFGPVLSALLVDDGVGGPVDFRSLSVREFGTIYEGLLESSLSTATCDLTLDDSRSYVPARPGDLVEVKTGDIYLHNASGQRKATGSYFTKQFAVEHLLDVSLEPAIKDHLSRVAALLAKGDDAAAQDAFFDFRVVDLAMGSAHFLVAAIDRIEARFSSFLTEHPLPAVIDELGRLRAAAAEALGATSLEAEIDNVGLLRRQIARRCIYGLDLNLMAVELGRLAVWIHTFVPGLPMSSLDHNLTPGDSLTGIGTLDEVLDVLAPQRDGTISLFEEPIRTALSIARDQLLRVARTAEATKQEVREAARAYEKAMRDASDTEHLFDAAVAVRMGLMEPPVSPEAAARAVQRPGCRDELAKIRPVHFPVRFPEIFLRERPGFDVVLGNPPWDELVYEELKFWTLVYPGLKSMRAAEQERAVLRYRRERPDLVAVLEQEKQVADRLRECLMTGPYPGMGSGNADLYKAFCWRFLQELRDGGRLGVVLPRGALSAAGCAEWRETLLDIGRFTEVTTILNNGQWAFDDVDGRYTFALVGAQKRKGSEPIRLAGTYRSLSEFVHSAGVADIDPKALRSWSTGAAFPLLPTPESLPVFLRLRSHPRLDAPGGDWTFRPLQGDFNQTTDRALFIVDPHKPQGDLQVYKGSSFNLWAPDGVPFGTAVTIEITRALLRKRHRQARTATSPYFGLTSKELAGNRCLAVFNPRIAFRDVARATDSRTVICALVPPNTVLTNKAPYLVQRLGDEQDEAYLLGVLSSIPLDWYARRYVEISLNFHILNALPVPRPDRDNPLRKRVVEIAGRLAAVDKRYRTWAAAVGVEVGSVKEVERAELVAELDAVVALLYGLERPGVEHLFRTFHHGWDPGDRLHGVLKSYDKWAGVTKA